MFNNIKHYTKKTTKPIKRFFLAKKIHSEKRTFPVANVQELNTLMVDRAFLHDDEVPILQKYAATSPNAVAEIGCAFGASSILILANLPPASHLFSIDPFIKDSMGTLHATEARCICNVRTALKNLKRTDKIKQWSQMVDYSYNLSSKWKEPLDLIFIDGDHTYDAVKQDFEQWYPHVRVGGVIIFHDSRKQEGTPSNTFNRGWAGPTKLANELKKESRVKLVEEAFSMTVWKKLK